MKVTTTPGQFLDMAVLHIETGATYDGPQKVIARAVKMEQVEESAVHLITFRIVDDSRCVYEKVQVPVTWYHIRRIQNDTKTQLGIERMARAVMDEYLNSRYV